MTSPEQTISKAIEQIISSSSEQITSLKGLLKGKGEHEDSFMVIKHAKFLRERVKKLMEELLEIVNVPPYTFFNIKMRIQNSKENSYLRWRDNTFTLMGMQVWENAMLNPPKASPENIVCWLNDLTQFEQARLILNKHMSYLVMLIKQHKEYLENLNYSHSILEQAKKALHKTIR